MWATILLVLVVAGIAIVATSVRRASALRAVDNALIPLGWTILESKYRPELFVMSKRARVRVKVVRADGILQEGNVYVGGFWFGPPFDNRVHLWEPGADIVGRRGQRWHNDWSSEDW